MSLTKFGQRVRAARKTAGMTQADLADILDVTRPAISGIEAGKNGIPIGKLETLCKALRVTPNMLLGFD